MEFSLLLWLQTLCLMVYSNNNHNTDKSRLKLNYYLYYIQIYSQTLAHIPYLPLHLRQRMAMSCSSNQCNLGRHLYLTSLEHPIQLPHKQYSHSFFIAFRGGCYSISQRENQLHGKILLKTLILKNRVRLDKEFGSFSFTIVFFAQILWRLISSTATIFSF